MNAWQTLGSLAALAVVLLVMNQGRKNYTDMARKLKESESSEREHPASNKSKRSVK